MSKHAHTSDLDVSRIEVLNRWNYVVIALAVGFFIFACVQLNLTQDDAYISFRYAANYLSGHGLVYNDGERVEGYTNFFWIMLLALFKGMFGINFLLFSRFAGALSGSAIFYFLFLLLKQYFENVPLSLHISLAAMLLCNLSLPYWSIASLETSAFACMALAAIVAEYRRLQLTPALLIIATLLRPEGIIVFSMILIHRILTDRRLLWPFILPYSIALLPFAAFKLFYFNDLFPNPFYAKTGVGIEYMQSGLEYFWHFTRTVGVFGFIFIVPLLAVKQLWKRFSLLYIYVLIYTLYIIFVGGDVLKAYRFFIPIIPVLYFLLVVSLVELVSFIKMNRRFVYCCAFLCAVAFSYSSYSLSYQYIERSRDAERLLINNMRIMSVMLKSSMGPKFSIAMSTIGVAGYQLLGHRVIDMLGLTNAHIARNPEKNDGIVSGWKERRFNNRYLLEQQPDFILFSTGYKPSAPAERSLMLHSEFRRCYSTIGFMHENIYFPVWQRKKDVDISKDIVSPHTEFVSTMYDGLNCMNQTPDAALAEFRVARQQLGEEYALFSYFMGKCFLMMNNKDSASIYFNQALALDTLNLEARIGCIEIAKRNGDTSTVAAQKRILYNYFPWVIY
jgi:hypothetical protein